MHIMNIFTLLPQTIQEILDWRSFLDIVLIAMGLFFLYQTLRRLGTWKIVLGILIAAVVFIVARLLELKGIEWIYSNLTSVAVIALIVIFQPELRKVFESAASLGWGKKISYDQSNLSFLFSDAVFALAEQRRGAIFVFPGKESIKAWTSEGIALNAKPSFQLIMSIFDRHSPGHDGAMVIENGEVSAFSVYLPLSKTDKLSKAFGTRHRAAMGLSEVTDALVIVVSEERGNVTIFSKGRVQPPKDKSEVVSKIVSHWETTASYPLSKQKGKKQWVMVSEMAVCLILAFLFSSVVAPIQSEIREMGFTVPVEYILSPQKDITPVGEGPKSVELRLAGLASELYKIEPSRLRVQIDLSQKELGKHTVYITENQIQGLPAGVRLRDVNPSSIMLSLKQLKEQEVMVKLNRVGKLPEGLEIVSIEVNPQKVRVFSPVDDRRQGEITLMTTPIYLQNIKESTTLSCQIIASPGTLPADQQWPDIAVKIKIRDKSLFSIDLGGQNNLALYVNGNQITNSLRRRFRYGGIPLSESATIAKQKKDDTWLITDRDRKRTYWVRKEGDKLNIYSSKYKID